MSDLRHSIRSLEQGHWFKLICGASFQHLPSVRSLALAYGLAGADCVDVAADPAVVLAARLGLEGARSQRQRHGLGQPLLMVSLNDGEDPHFRKATFDPSLCPEDCPRPCEKICPAQAIASSSSVTGVIESRCYGCGRCLPICPLGLITAYSSVSAPASVMASMMEAGVDAIEIHTQMGRTEDFGRLWTAIAPWVDQLQLVAISCPDADRGHPSAYADYLRQLHGLMQPSPRVIIWQTDGRPMSGDIGAGTTHAAIQLARKLMFVEAASLPGFIQLAGGTNLYTVPKLRSMGLLKQDVTHAEGGFREHSLASSRAVAGVAYGSFARSHLGAVLDALENRTGTLEDHPDLLQQAVALAAELIEPLKSTTLNYSFSAQS